MSKKLTTIDFINKSKLVHGDKYDYSKSVYINCHTKVCVICPIHGEFMILPNKHYIGQGCRKCGYITNSINQTLSKEEFIDKARKVHGDKYDYSKLNYINNHTKVNIICSEHGEFWQTPNSHLNGRGCKKCGIIQRALKQRSNTQDFIEKSRKIHGDKYDYSKVDYINNETKIRINCPKHGEFSQTPTHHLAGEGCPKCKYENIAQKQSHNIDFVLNRFKEKHGNKYDYSKIEYNGLDKKVCINCPKHGDFWQEPWVHMKGCGCPKCGVTLSRNEDEIVQFLQNMLGVDAIESRNRTILGNRQELDVVVPSKKICIEYNGLLWHSDKFQRMGKTYHLRKTEICENKGYRLIHIFEDEYVNHKDIVLAKLKHILHANQELPVINARQTTIKELDKKTAKEFLEQNHIQGYAKSTLYIGAFYQELLIGVMTFKKKNKNSNDWILIRFATDINYRHRGVGGKLFKFFIRKYNPNSIKSFADRRWTVNNNNLYLNLGFKCIEIYKPDYCYYDEKSNNLERIPKYKCRKQNLHKKYEFPLSMTEQEMARELQLYRIYDCGYLCYEWNNENS